MDLAIGKPGHTSVLRLKGETFILNCTSKSPLTMRVDVPGKGRSYYVECKEIYNLLKLWPEVIYNKDINIL